MTAKLDPYSDVLQRLVYEIEACSPPLWERGELSIQSDGAQLSYGLRNEGHPDRATLTDELRELIEEIFARMRDGGDGWKSARIRWWIEGGAIRCDPSFDYTGEAAAARKKSWWKR